MNTLFLSESLNHGSEDYLATDVGLAEAYLGLAESLDALSEANTNLLIADFASGQLSESGEKVDKLKALFQKWMRAVKSVLERIKTAIKAAINKILSKLTGSSLYVLTAAKEAFNNSSEEVNTLLSNDFVANPSLIDSTKTKLADIMSKYENTMKSLDPKGPVEEGDGGSKVVSRGSIETLKRIDNFIKEIEATEPKTPEEFTARRSAATFFTNEVSKALTTLVSRLQSSLVRKKNETKNAE